MKIALLQINPTVGDLAGNARLIAGRARATPAPRGADLAVTPELGARRLSAARSPAQRAASSAAAGKPLHALASRCWRRCPRCSSGCPSRTRPTKGGRSSTAPSLLETARSTQRFRKALLPTYDVFDEDRYFEPFHGPQMLDLGGCRLGISICEDVWNDRDFWKRRRYHHDPIEELVRAGADAIVNLSASPFTARQARAARGDARRAWRVNHRVPVVYVESVRRQRRPGLRRTQLRVRRERRADRPRPFVRRRRRHLRSGPPDACSAARRRGRRIRDLAGAGARHAGLREQVRLPRRGARPVRRHRLRADGRDRRRGAGAVGGPRRADAIAVLQSRQPRRCASACREPRHPDDDAADRRRDARVRRSARRRVQQSGLERREGEHAGANPRQPADGAVEQPWRAAADDGEQVRAARSATARSMATCPAVSR